MQKGVSILFALVMMISSAHLTIATHYCGGKFAASKISLSGKLATCGMMDIEESCASTETHLNTHCCENNVVTIGFINNFTAPDALQSENTQSTQNHFYLPVTQSYNYISEFNHTLTNIHPPGGFSTTAVDLNNICAFRI